MNAARWRGLALGLLPFALACGLAFRWLGTVPIWDGMYYFDCVLRATQSPYPASAFVCADHPPLYLFLAGWPQYFVHGSALALNLANLAWLLFGIAGYARLIDAVAEPAGALEKALAVAVFACAPLVLAVTLHFAADEGLLVFLPWVLDGFVRRRTLQTIVTGAALCLCKEPGLVLFAVAWATAVAVRWPSGRRAGQMRELRIESAGLLGAFAPALVYLAVRHASGASIVNGEALDARVDYRLLPGLAVLFLLNFVWLAWLVPLGAWLMRAGRRLEPGETILLGTLTLSAVVLSALVPFNNPRYFAAPLVPLLALSYALLRRSVPARPRMLFLAALVGLELAAQFQTLDPVSIAAFGRAPYGTMRMHCGFLDEAESCRGRDQLVYNQQFLELPAAQDAVFRAVRPGSDATFLVAPDATYLMHTPLDPATFEKTLRGGAVLTPRFATLAELQKEDAWPETLYVIDYPRLGFTGRARLERRYEVVSEAAYGGRLKLPVTTLKRRGPA